MVWYAVRKYLVWTAVVSTAIAVLWLLGPMPKANPNALMFRAIFWGGVIGAVVTYYMFKRDNLWVLYSNLRISRFVLLGVLFCAVQFLNVIALWLLYL